jgi:hypothetical protein
MKRYYIVLLIALLMIMRGTPSDAAKQRLFVKPFTSINLPGSDSSARIMTKKIEEVFFVSGGYDPLTQEDVLEGVNQAQQERALGKNDEKDLKILLSVSHADLIIYGSVKRANAYIYVTAKMLDKRSGDVTLSRVKTFRIRESMINSPLYDEGCTALAKYILDGDSDIVQDFQDKVYREEKRIEKGKRDNALQSESQSDQNRFDKSVEEFKIRRRNEIAGKYAFMRIGYSRWGMTARDEVFNKYYDRGTLFMGDIVVPMNRSSLSGFDILFRYTYKRFERKSGVIGTDPSMSDLLIKGKSVSFNLMDFGLRYRLGLYLLMTKFDLYGLLSYRTDYLKSGWCSGAGIEIAFFQTIGFFGEYNYGSFKVGNGKHDIENNQYIFGTTLRL